MSRQLKKLFGKAIPFDRSLSVVLPFFLLTFILTLFTPDLKSAQAQGKKDNGGTERTLSLESLLDEVLKVNPEILATRERVEESRAIIPQSRALPDPDLELEGSNVGSRRITLGEEPESMVGIKISQEFPVAGKRGLRKQIAETEAEQVSQNLRATEWRIMTLLKANYYDLQALYKALEIIEKNKDLLKNFARTAEARYAVGQGIQQDIFKAQVEISTLIQRQTQLEQQKLTSKAALNALLNRSTDSPLEEPDPLVQEKTGATLDQLQALSLDESPVVKASQFAVKTGESNLTLARKAYYPDVKIGLGYQNRGEMDSVFSLSFMIPIPVYYKSKQNYQVQEAASALKAANYELQATKQETIFRVREQIYTLKASERVIELLEKATIPQAGLTLESSMAAYRVGQVDFLTLLNNLLTLFNLELEYYQEITNYNKTLARLEDTFGTALTK